jgi:hypothetical protein
MSVVRATAIGQPIKILTGHLEAPEKVAVPITVMVLGQDGGFELFQ